MKIGYGAGAIGDYEWQKEESRAEREKKAMECLEACRILGVRVIDTANRYSGGESEQTIGNYLRQKPETDFFIVTKVDLNSPDKMFEKLYESTLRLGRKPDCLLIHNPDFGKRKEVVEAGSWLMKKVKGFGIHYYGFSTEPTRETKVYYEAFDLNAIEFPFSKWDVRAIKEMEWLQRRKDVFVAANRVLGGPIKGGKSSYIVEEAVNFLGENKKMFDVALIGTTNVGHLEEIFKMAEGK